MLALREDKLTPTLLLSRQREIIDRLYTMASVHATENKINVMTTVLEDDNWHCQITLKCWDHPDYHNDPPTFEVFYGWYGQGLEHATYEIRPLKETGEYILQHLGDEEED